jgi:hypothetical protein
VTVDNPILFVTQVPVEGFGTVTSTFGNHEASMASVPRGGDLMIVYPDGTLRNLTREAGYGDEGESQGANAIAVREPAVHWSGDRAVFSMVVGAPSEQYEVDEYRWQLYEVTGLAQGETAAITPVANQPAYNNVAPIYATDGVDIIFASDRPRGGHAHHYPQLDEYESSPTVAGLYRLTPATGTLTMIEHAPSGAFSPSIDSYGRVVFTKWDHLQRDQQAIAQYQPFTWESEAADAPTTTVLAGAEVFPEPRETGGNVSGHTFNQFFPWEVNEDGTAEETVNHVGRHELGGSYTEGSFMDDPNLTYLSPEENHANRYRIDGDGGMFHLAEDPLSPGRYYATHAPEFGTASSGDLLRMDAPLGESGDDVVLTLVAEGNFRDPLPLRDGRLIASHTEPAENASDYAFRLREVAGGAAGAPLTAGIRRTVRWWTPDVEQTFDGELWELDAVEVIARDAPAPRESELAAAEAAVLADLGIDEAALRAWMRERDLALIVVRNATLRDRGDLNQPFNLRVPGGVEAIATGGRVYDVSHLQLVGAMALRGYEGDDGRRLLARPVEGVPYLGGGPTGAAVIAPDGSVATFVPAMRAMAWQLIAPDGTPVVRERNWVSFQAGEIRGCPVCHGINTESQLGTGIPENEPAALRMLLEQWQADQ